MDALVRYYEKVLLFVKMTLNLFEFNNRKCLNWKSIYFKEEIEISRQTVYGIDLGEMRRMI
ncbi:hypothetical protein T05_15643 [Trichinella murrelli]|uniref:Uncharacterized protein n=1 Tax=Trichinella murrelli TaxID=144512 RepID=A0A0V0TF10_9BILA|nr:hypothetical protein T05_15643 [Trichinella murrelli]